MLTIKHLSYWLVFIDNVNPMILAIWKVLSRMCFQMNSKALAILVAVPYFDFLVGKWMAKFTSQMSASFSKDKTPIGVGEAQIIWLSIE